MYLRLTNANVLELMEKFQKKKKEKKKMMAT